MEIFDTLNNYLIHHPHMLVQLGYAFRIKFWCLLAVVIYFLILVYKRDKQARRKSSIKDGQFLA